MRMFRFNLENELGLQINREDCSRHVLCSRILFRFIYLPNELDSFIYARSVTKNFELWIYDFVE